MKPVAWLSLGACLVLALSIVFTPATLPEVNTCSFYAWTGVPCAGCGMTRAFCSLGHAEWHDAWAYHPLSYPLYFAVVLAAAWPLVERLAPFAKRLARPRVLFGAALGYSVALAAFGVWRAWPLVAARF